MLHNKIDSNKYKEDFKKRFESFGDKSPIVISYAVDDFEVMIVHENSGKQYHYPWDFSIPVRSFIHKIKQDLSYNHYPRITRIETITENLTPEQQAEMIANGTPIDNVPSTKIYEKEVVYRIDKIIAMRDEFVLICEDTGTQYLYKMNTSSIYFLKNYREGKFKDPKEAGDYFFSHASLINDLNS